MRPVDEGLQFISSMTDRQFQRFQHLDSKANNFLEMLGIAFSLLASIGLFGMKDFLGPKDQSPDLNKWKDCFLKPLAILYSLVGITLILSFYFALLATLIPLDKDAKHYFSQPLPMFYDISGLEVYGLNNSGLEKEEYKRYVFAEFVKVYQANFDSLLMKAGYLSRSQNIAFGIAILLLGITMLLCLSVFAENHVSKPLICDGKDREKVGNGNIDNAQGDEKKKKQHLAAHQLKSGNLFSI